MKIFAFFTSLKQIVNFDLDEENSKVTIQTCPATLIGWVLNKFIENMDTNIYINQHLFVLEQWGFTGRSTVYIPVKNVTTITMREVFRTVMILFALFCFAISIMLTPLQVGEPGAFLEPILKNAEILFYLLGTGLLLVAIFFKRQVLVTIYRGSLTHHLRFRADDEQLQKLKKMLELIMFISTGAKTELPNSLPKSTSVTKEDKEKKERQAIKEENKEQIEEAEQVTSPTKKKKRKKKKKP